MSKGSTSNLPFPVELSLVTHLSYRLGDQRSIDGTLTSDIEGKKLRYYANSDNLGAGCYGLVKKAVSNSTGQVVAIKRLHPKNERAQKIFRENFLSENLLEGEHGVFVQAVPQGYASSYYDPNKDIMVMPFINGKEIKEISHHCTTSQWFNICSQLTEQITQLHRKGITHGDFYGGSNVIISYGKVKLIDFGLATNRGNEEKRDDTCDDRKLGLTTNRDSERERDDTCDDGKMDTFFSNLSSQLYPGDSKSESSKSSDYSDIIQQLENFLLEDARRRPLYDFLSQDDKKQKLFLKKTREYLSEEIGKTQEKNSKEIHEAMASILLKISFQNASSKELTQFDIDFLKWYFEQLYFSIEKSLNRLNRLNQIRADKNLTSLYNSLKKELLSYMGDAFGKPCFQGSIFKKIERKEAKSAQAKVNKFRKRLQNIASNYLNTQLSSLGIIDITNLIYQEETFLFLLDLLPPKERLDILDKYHEKLYKKEAIEHDLNIISNIYFKQYQCIANLMDANKKIKLIKHAEKNHTITKLYDDKFKEEKIKYFSSISMEKEQNFIENPNADTLIDFLMNLQNLYQDVEQPKNQLRQAMVIISHIFQSNSDKTPSEKALLDLKQLILSVESRNSKNVRRAVFKTFLWIQKHIESANPKDDDLTDVKERFLSLTENSQFKEFKKKEEESSEKQQEQFREKSIKMIKKRIFEINENAFLFKKSNTMADIKTKHLTTILAKTKECEFVSLGDLLKPETLKSDYPDLFQTRQLSFSFWDKRNNPQSTKTYKMFEEISDSYNKVMDQTAMITSPSPR